MNKFYVLTIIILFTAIGCKRFDSDGVNRRLIQGRWQQVEIVYPDVEADSLTVEQPNGLTYLNFEEDSCIEELVDLNMVRRYHFHIKDYELTLTEKDNEPNKLEIDKLTADSLLLQIKYRMWKYIKIKDAD